MENSLFQNPLLYDSQYQTLTKDIRFYTKLAKQTGGPVLELGMGTGRIAHSILEAGIPLSGVDVSEEMLAAAKEYLKPFSNICKIQKASFSDFQLEERFKLIFSGFNSLHHLTDIDDFQKLLFRVRDHLQPEGLFVFDIINPHPSFLKNQIEQVLRERYFDEQILSVCEVWETYEYDWKTQRKSHQWEYRWENGRKESQTLTHRLFFPEEIQRSLELSKFKIIQHAGDFDGAGFSTISPKQIFVCQFSL